MKVIDKDALVAEIKKKIEINLKRNEESVDKHDDYGTYYWGGVIAGLNVALMLCDTLEVKEVDSRLTLEDISILRQIMFDYNKQVRNEMSIPNNEDYCKEVLKRFKAQNGEKKD